MEWVRSSYSYSNGNCVEVGPMPRGRVGVRDSKDPDGPVLSFSPAAWAAFLAGIRSGELASDP